MEFTVTDACDGMTVYRLLRSRGASGTLIKLLKTRPHGITVNGADAAVRAVVHTNDIVAANFDDTFGDENSLILPSCDSVDILYEDDAVFVINKPSGMPTHTSHGHYTDTLENALAAEYRRRGKPFVFRPVNRLDGDTSGAVLVAKDRFSASVMARHMEAGHIRKKYVAVLDGELDAECGQSVTVRSYIRRRKDTIILRESVGVDDPDASGDYAETTFICLYKGCGHSIVEAFPVTGRTHQLRVHFASLGHPITGDELYSGSRSLISRQALHARSITFPSAGGESGEICVRAPFPNDISELAAKIRCPFAFENERNV